MGVASYTDKSGRRKWKADFRARTPDGKERRVIKKEIPTKEMAIALVNKAQAEAFEGRWFDKPKTKVLTVKQTWDNYEPVAKMENRDWPTEVGRARHFVRHLGKRQAATLTLRDIQRYRELRTKEPNLHDRLPAVSTINREVALLRHAINHAVLCGDLDRNPLVGVKMVEENNVREVVIGEADFDRLLDAAEPFLRPILLMAFDTGMRKAEILGLRWEQVSLKEGTVRLSAAETKGKHARIIVLTTRVLESLKGLPRAIGGFVFTNPQTGKSWNHIQKAVDRARTAAGLEHVWFHDLRRSFVTNARRRGVPESVVMRMSGHKTRSVFDRYNVVSEEDLRVAVARIEAGQKEESNFESGGNLGKDLEKVARSNGR